MRNRVMFVFGGLLLGAVFVGLGFHGVLAAPVLRLPQDFLTLTAVMFPGDGLAGAPLAYVDNGEGPLPIWLRGGCGRRRLREEAHARWIYMRWTRHVLGPMRPGPGSHLSERLG